ncbi:MAG: rhomboid-like protein [Rhodobacteraceae bacterium HLUCCA12]|nr:MAG: rhomboid-like protein [Rhodobacteraceae bacterium HLUCCA12]
MTRNDHDDSPSDAPADPGAAPLNPLPVAVWLAIGLIGVIEAALWAGGAGLIGGAQAVGWRLSAIERLAFSGAIQTWMLETGRFPVSHLLRYPAFGLIHAGPMHAFLVIVLLAALGKFVAEALGARVFLAVLLIAPMAGAILFGLIMADHSQAWLLGGMPAAFALVGAVTWWRWRAAGNPAGRRQAFGLIAVLLAARLGFGLIAETGQVWIAECAAFGFGLALAALFAPGTWPALRAWMRRR